MALEGCAACLKYLLIIWNFIILVLGIAILGVGIWMVVDKGSGQFVDDIVPDDSPVIISYDNVSDSGIFSTLAYVLIAFGVITVVVAFLGYCGAMRESQCLLATCFVLLFVIFAALVGMGVYLYIKKDEIDVDKDKLYPLLKDTLKDAVDNYYENAQSKNFMDAVQKQFDCCGTQHGAIDYAPTLAIPSSCSPLSYTSPCLDPYCNHVAANIGVKQFFSGKMTIGMAVALGVAGGLILAMLLTLFLCCSVRRSGSY